MSINSANKKLGRGLSVLFGEAGIDESSFNLSSSNEDIMGSEIKEVTIDAIKPNKDQPRREFDFDALNALADSIKEKGILQPILLRKKERKKETEKNNDTTNQETFYEIIAGERRWRAARIAGLKKIPALIKKYDDKETLEIALIENIQRADLDPIEEAQAYQHLMEHHRYTQEKLSEVLGKNRSTIAHILRFLKLDPAVQKALRERKITNGHAKLLLGLQNAAEICEKIIQNNLTIRESEKLIAAFKKEKKLAKNKKMACFDKDALNYAKPVIKNLEKKLSSYLGEKALKCKIDQNGATIQIKMQTIEELEALKNIFTS